MAIGTFAELKTALANWLDRSDMTSRIPEFIALFEAKANRRLRVRQQMTTATLTPSSGAAALPSDYLEWRRVTWAGDVRRELEYVEPGFLQLAYPTTPSAYPNFFTIEGSSLLIRPVDGTGIQLLYYAKIPALSDAATTNWLLTAHPDAYLFGSLVEASAFKNDTESGVAWNSRLEGVLAEIERLSAASRGQAMMRAIGPTP